MLRCGTDSANRVAAAPPPRSRAVPQFSDKQAFAIAVYLELGAAGSRWLEANTAEEYRERTDLILHSLSRFDYASLRPRVSCLKRVQRWAAEQQIVPWWAMSPLQVGRMLHQWVAGGPTAAASVFDHLSWWKAHIGVPLPLEHPVVADFRRTEPGHTESPVSTFEPWQLLNLAKFAFRTPGPPGQLARILVLVAATALRARHLSRCSEPTLAGTHFSSWIFKGKRVVRGSRPGFMCSWKRSLFGSDDFFLPLRALYHSFEETGLEWPGLLPAIYSQKQGTITAEATWLSRPMSETQSSSLLRAVMVAACAGSGNWTLKSLKKFLPTAANVLRLDDSDAQAVGHWQEIIKGDGAEACSRRRAIFPMCHRYADQKHLYSAEVRHFLWMAMFRSARLRGLQPALGDSLLAPGSLTWDHIRELRSSLDDPSPITEEPMEPIVQIPATVTAIEPDSGSCSGVMHWFRIFQRVHVVAFYAEGGAPVSLCRAFSAKPFKTLPNLSGSGATSAHEAGLVCGICMGRFTG